ncbi:MAG: hypothetical protein ACJAYU_003194 [Bradymonadia bacterium]|jgi:hypothetical protein
MLAERWFLPAFILGQLSGLNRSCRRRARRSRFGGPTPEWRQKDEGEIGMF